MFSARHSRPSCTIASAMTRVTTLNEVPRGHVSPSPRSTAHAPQAATPSRQTLTRTGTCHVAWSAGTYLTRWIIGTIMTFGGRTPAAINGRCHANGAKDRRTSPPTVGVGQVLRMHSYVHDVGRPLLKFSYRRTPEGAACRSAPRLRVRSHITE